MCYEPCAPFRENYFGKTYCPEYDYDEGFVALIKGYLTSWEKPDSESTRLRDKAHHQTFFKVSE
jgi:hypothetical protein